MKIRLDYVSNSSSSSFMLVGYSYERDEVMDAMKRHKFNFYEDVSPLEKEQMGDFERYDYEREAFYTYVDEWLEKFGLKYHDGIYDYGDLICIGLSYDDMKPDETKADFEKRIGAALEQVFGSQQKVECMIDGGTDC